MKRPLYILSFTFFLLFGRELMAQQSASEYVLKSAYIERFTRFIEWPQGLKGKTVQIGVIGKGNSIDALKQYFSTTPIQGCYVEVIHVTSLGELSTFEIIFIEDENSFSLQEILQSLPIHSTTLTIGNQSYMAEKGIMIALNMVDKKLKFIVNYDEAQRKGFKMSSMFLNLATLTTTKETKHE